MKNIYDTPAIRLIYPLMLATAVATLAGGATGLGMNEVVVISGTINLVYVVGLYLFVGNSGVVSFGHVAFAALGAYAVGILTSPVEAKAVLLPRLPDVLRDISLAPALAFGFAGAGVVALAGIFGFAIMKLKGIAASIVTLSFLVIGNEILNNWRGLGNGGTVTRIPTETTLAQVLAVATGCIVVAYLFQTSAYGLRLRAARDEENAARALGIGVAGERTLAFVIGAVMMAVGGGLSARLSGTISPDAFFLNLTFLTMAMLVVGGMHSLFGAVTGAVLVTALNEALRQAEAMLSSAGINVVGWRDIVVAAILVTLLILRPEGLTRGREFDRQVLAGFSRKGQARRA